MFRYDYNIRYSDYKDFETVKTSAILEVIQEAAILNSASCGFGIDNLRGINRAWLLQGINVRIENPVSTYYPLIAKTAVKNLKGVLSDLGNAFGKRDLGEIMTLVERVFVNNRNASVRRDNAGFAAYDERLVSRLYETVVF